MNYAVIKTGGKQYKVQIGSVIEVDKLDVDPESSLKFDQVLLIASDGAYQVGMPIIAGASVTGQVLEQKKGEKIRVAKFKAKARYRKVIGHRQLLTKIKIEKINSMKKKKSSKASAVSAAV
jgi:large subunit ribosomal protein L21